MIETISNDDYEEEVCLKLYDFGEVDEVSKEAILNFVSFIRNNIQDYDDSKHINFYVVIK